MRFSGRQTSLLSWSGKVGKTKIQQHRHQQNWQYAESAQLPVRFVRRDEKTGKEPGVWRVHQPYNGNLKVSSLLRKGSPCATIIKCIGASSHSEKGASEWVKVYEAKNAVRVSAKERTVYITHGSAGHARSCLYQLAYRGTSEEQFLWYPLI